ncbi:MAG: dihydrodipicolinate synthase family protein [Rhodospirillaceae bacterium]|nr:dihydrodipicolinate synthase family protein [Rhodospirillaceae bacterium]
MSPQPAAGLWPPVATPFRTDLSVDLDALVALCRKLLADGAHGLAVLGTTSEANSLDLAERRMVLERLVEAGIPTEALLPGTGACAVGDAAALTAHAVGLGVRGVLLLPPFYYKNVSDDGLFAFVSAVIERVGDARLAVYLYNFPQMTTLAWSPALIERLLKAWPRTVLGLKDSSGDVAYVDTLLRSFPGFAVFPSSEALMLAALRKGAAGCISATANINAAAICRLYDAWRSPGADALAEPVAAVRRLVQGFPMIPAVKAVLAARTGRPDWARVRPPLDALDAARTRQLLDGLAALTAPA